MNGTSFLIIALAFAGSMLFSGLETGGYLLNRIRLRVRARQGQRSAIRLQKCLHDAHRFIFTVLIGNNIVNYLISSEVTGLYSAAGVRNAETAATLTLLLPLFLFGELIPKMVFRHHADTLMYRFSGFLYLAQRVFSPVTAFLKTLFNLISGGRGRREERGGFTLSLQGFREYFAGDTQRHTLSAHQHGMIDNLVSMHRVPVRQIMKPVASMIQISEKSTVEQVLDLMRTHNTGQVAVYCGPARHVTGLINLSRLMDTALKPDEPIKPLLHKTIRVTDSMSLSQAFRKLRKRNGQTAAVVDRFSRVVGFLHLRDIAGYIVSEV